MPREERNCQCDYLQETKGKLEELQKRLRQAKEETEQIRRNCQAMILTYQVKGNDSCVFKHDYVFRNTATLN